MSTIFNYILKPRSILNPIIISCVIFHFTGSGKSQHTVFIHFPGSASFSAIFPCSAVSLCVRDLDLDALAVFEREGQRLVGAEGCTRPEQPVGAKLLYLYIVGIGEADTGHIRDGDLRHAKLFKKSGEGDLTLARDGVCIIAPVEVHGIGAHKIDRKALRSKAHGAALHGEVRDGLGGSVVMDVPDLEFKALLDGGVRDADGQGVSRLGLIFLSVQRQGDIICRQDMAAPLSTAAVTEEGIGLAGHEHVCRARDKILITGRDIFRLHIDPGRHLAPYGDGIVTAVRLLLLWDRSGLLCRLGCVGMCIIVSVGIHSAGAQKIDREALHIKAHGAALHGEVRDGLGGSAVMDVPYLELKSLFNCGVRDVDGQGFSRLGLILLPVQRQRDIIRRQDAAALFRSGPVAEGYAGLVRRERVRGSRVKSLIALSDILHLNVNPVRHLTPYGDGTFGVIRTVRVFRRVVIFRRVVLIGCIRSLRRIRVFRRFRALGLICLLIARHLRKALLRLRERGRSARCRPGCTVRRGKGAVCLFACIQGSSIRAVIFFAHGRGVFPRPRGLFGLDLCRRTGLCGLLRHACRSLLSLCGLLGVRFLILCVFLLAGLLRDCSELTGRYRRRHDGVKLRFFPLGRSLFCRFLKLFASAALSVALLCGHGCLFQHARRLGDLLCCTGCALCLLGCFLRLIGRPRRFLRRDLDRLRRPVRLVCRPYGSVPRTTGCVFRLSGTLPRGFQHRARELLTEDPGSLVSRLFGFLRRTLRFVCKARRRLFTKSGGLGRRHRLLLPALQNFSGRRRIGRPVCQFDRRKRHSLLGICGRQPHRNNRKTLCRNQYRRNRSAHASPPQIFF